jgi:Holliday junction DNA helicase RuvA
MISRLTGTLAEVFEEAVLVDRDGVGFEVLVPRYAIRELAAVRGRRITLYTLTFVEGNATAGNLIPRLIGFTQAEDRLFFNRFITVKGMGIRKALKALAEPVTTVAVAIEQGDAKALSRLPGIGARAAEQIIAELRGKLEAFVVGAAAAGAAPEPQWTPAQRDALEILAALGERAADARRWLERAAEHNPESAAADEWVKAAYRVKAGAEG